MKPDATKHGTTPPPRTQPQPPTFGCQAGFTMVELSVVIVVLGILGAAVALFVRGPVAGYFSTIERAQLADSADLALRRLSRELLDALPNSVRVATSGGRIFIEFVPVDDVGRYRAAISAGAEPGGTDTFAPTDTADAQFQVLGAPVQVQDGAQLVIYNLGLSPLDVYAGENRRAVTNAPGLTNQLNFTAPPQPWPDASPTHRFYLVRTPVTYVCSPSADGRGRLERIAGYALSPTQPVDPDSAPLVSGTRSLVSAVVAECSAELGPVLANSNALALSLALGPPEGRVTLLGQIHLPMTP